MRMFVFTIMVMILIICAMPSKRRGTPDAPRSGEIKEQPLANPSTPDMRLNIQVNFGNPGHAGLPMNDVGTTSQVQAHAPAHVEQEALLRTSEVSPPAAPPVVATEEPVSDKVDPALKAALDGFIARVAAETEAEKAKSAKARSSKAKQSRSKSPKAAPLEAPSIEAPLTQSAAGQTPSAQPLQIDVSPAPVVVEPARQACGCRYKGECLQMQQTQNAYPQQTTSAVVNGRRCVLLRR